MVHEVCEMCMPLGVMWDVDLPLWFDESETSPILVNEASFV